MTPLATEHARQDLVRAVAPVASSAEVVVLIHAARKPDRSRVRLAQIAGPGVVADVVVLAEGAPAVLGIGVARPVSYVGELAMLLDQ